MKPVSVNGPHANTRSAVKAGMGWYGLVWQAAGKQVQDATNASFAYGERRFARPLPASPWAVSLASCLGDCPCGSGSDVAWRCPQGALLPENTKGGT